MKYLRKIYALNQSDLALLIGKGDTTIGNWEGGKAEPNITELITLAGYFEVSLDDLIITDLSKVSPDKSEHSYVSEPEPGYGEISMPASTKENALIAAQHVTIETLRKALKLAEEQIKFLKKGPSEP